jgi:crotonobetainyl-CoA:carnitine CoA-transferase CaiB-like acyl-CoA transferase
MAAVMQGVRILEVADHTFVPAASALLADWGAEVIKIEHVERGDAMRGLASSGLAMLGSKVHVLLEHSNRGKKSLALDLNSKDGVDILYRLAATSDVFLTNKLPSVRSKLKIDVGHLRAHNPNIIYVRGTGHGERGPDADRGSYDSLAYWCRAGIALGMKQPDDDSVPPPPGPAFGDSIGAMTIAGGIMGALFHRERTGKPTIVDVSLLGTGLWSHGAALALSLQLQRPWGPMPRGAAIGNPLVRTYRTKDERYISICCLQAAKYWPGICEVIGRPELARDERFADAAGLTKNAAAAGELLAAARAARTAAAWRARLASFAGQWSMVPDGGRDALQARRRARPVRRAGRRPGPGARIQRARRRRPRRARLRLGRDPRPQDPRRRRVNVS